MSQNATTAAGARSRAPKHRGFFVYVACCLYVPAGCLLPYVLGAALRSALFLTQQLECVLLLCFFSPLGEKEFEYLGAGRECEHLSKQKGEKP